MKTCALFLLSLLTLATTACLDTVEPTAEATPDERDDEPNEGTVEQLIEEDPCPNFACGQNGPMLNNRDFHELSDAGLPNREGFTVQPLVKGGVSYALSVVGWEMRGTDANGNIISGQQLENATFDIAHDTGRRYRVLINDVSTMPIYAGPKKGTMIPQYILKWIDVTPGMPAQHYTNLCARPPTGAYRQETLFQDGESTLVFEGNRYDSVTKRVLFGTSTWFNLGCAGHALSKLLLTGHTNISGSAPLVQQQAMLKAVTADYCGIGLSFTVSGEPLFWKTSNGYATFMSQPATLEARWNENGAVCLGEHRLLLSNNPLKPLYFPDAADGTPGVEVKMDLYCPALRMPPPCNSLPGNYDFAGSTVVTANPTFIP
jgi:hypothetical protein